MDNGKPIQASFMSLYARIHKLSANLLFFLEKNLTQCPFSLQSKQKQIHELQQVIVNYKQRQHQLEQQVSQQQTALHEAKNKVNFLTHMSHEIRTPLNGVLGMTVILADTPLSPEQQDYLKIIRSSSEILLNLINDILEYSRLGADKVVLETHVFDLRLCIEESLDLITAQAAQKGLNLGYQMADDVPPLIMGDRTRLRQIFVNLLNNAIKFTDQGHVWLDVQVSEIKEQNYTLSFKIHDTGIGIAKDKIHALFQPFSQVHSTVQRQYGGSGLGLLISKQLIEMMRGQIWLDSQLGQGSCFHFNIKALASVGNPYQLLSAPLPSLQGKQILIYSPDNFSRNLLRHCLQQWGGQLTLVTDKTELLRLLNQQVWDIGLCDFIENNALPEPLYPCRQVKNLILFGYNPEICQQDHIICINKPIKPLRLYNGIQKLLQTPAQLTDNTKKMPRILLAEDNKVNQKVLNLLLKNFSEQIKTVDNGLQALAEVERHFYDLIFMDIHMPKMDGLAATRAIRQLQQNQPRSAIIAMTASVLNSDKEHCLQAGMDDFISKPVRRESLARMIGLYCSV